MTGMKDEHNEVSGLYGQTLLNPVFSEEPREHIPRAKDGDHRNKSCHREYCHAGQGSAAGTSPCQLGAEDKERTAQECENQPACEAHVRWTLDAKFQSAGK